MKKLTKLGLVFACAFTLSLSVVCGSLNMQTTVSAEESQTVQFSETKIKRSQDMNYLLLATAVNNYEDVYEIGYDFEGYTVQDTDKVRNDAYFSSITTGGKTETAKEIFGDEYDGWGMIVWEVAYNPAEEISYTPYALVGVRNETSGELLKPSDPSLIDKEVGTDRTTPVLEKTVTFVDGETEVTRTAKYGVGLTESVPEFTGTPTTGKEFYWALADGTEVASFDLIIEDITVTKTERTIVNSVAFDFDLDVTYDDGYEFLTADGEDELSKNVDFEYGENIAFAVYVKNEFNRSVDNVKYVFHNTDGTTKDFTASEVENNLVVYTLDATDAGDGYVEMVGEYEENTYEFVLNLNLYDWGVLDSLNGITVTIGGESVEIVDGKVETTLAAGTHSVVVTEPTSKVTEVEVVVAHPTTWNDCLNFGVEKTVTVGYSSFSAADSAGNDRTSNYTQDLNGMITAGSSANNANNTVTLTDYTIDGSKDYVVKARFTYKGGTNASPDFQIILTNGTDSFTLGVNKLYFRIVNGTEFKPQYGSYANAFATGLTNGATTPFTFDLMIVKSADRLSIYHTIGSSEFIHFGDVTASGIVLPNGSIATGYTSGEFDATASNRFTAFLNATDLQMKLVTLGDALTEYTEYGVKTANFTANYTVEHYLQKADNSYALKETETLTGVTNTVAKAVAKSYDGYALASANQDAVLQGEIAEDGSLVLKVYYYIAKNFTAMNGTSDYTEYFTRDENGVISATNASYVNNTYIQLNETFDGSGDYELNVRFTYKGGNGTDPVFYIDISNGKNHIWVYLSETQYIFAIYNPNTGVNVQLDHNHNLGDAYKMGVNSANNDYRESAKTNPFVFDIKIVKTSDKLSIYHTIGSTDGSYILLDEVDQAFIMQKYSATWAGFLPEFLSAKDLKLSFKVVENSSNKLTYLEYSNYYVTTSEEN